MRRPLSRGLAIPGTLGALAWMVASGVGCAQDPTELYVYVGVDATVPPSITSLMVTVTGATGATSRVFQSLDNAAPDANIPTFRFPAFLDLQLTRDGIAGPVQVEVDASDPTTGSDAILATATVPANLPGHKTTSVDVVLTAVPPSAGGGAGGAGGAGETGAGGMGGDGAGGAAGADGLGGAGSA